MIQPVREPLTARQNECMRWVAANKSDAEIAALLGISAATAHFHIERAKERLNARGRAHAVSLMVLDGAL